MEWLNLIFGIIGIILGIFGTIAFQKLVIQKNKLGDNVYNEGYSAVDVAKIVKSIHELSDDQITQVKEALLDEFDKRPRIFTGSDVPKNAQDGDLWFHEIKGDDKE